MLRKWRTNWNPKENMGPPSTNWIPRGQIGTCVCVFLPPVLIKRQSEGGAGALPHEAAEHLDHILKKLKEEMRTVAWLLLMPLS